MDPILFVLTVTNMTMPKTPAELETMLIFLLATLLDCFPSSRQASGARHIGSVAFCCLQHSVHASCTAKSIDFDCMFDSSFAAAACFSSLLDFCPHFVSVGTVITPLDPLYRRLSAWCKDSYGMSGHILTTRSQGLWCDVLTFASSSSATGNFSYLNGPAGFRLQSP